MPRKDNHHKNLVNANGFEKEVTSHEKIFIEENLANSHVHNNSSNDEDDNNSDDYSNSSDEENFEDNDDDDDDDEDDNDNNGHDIKYTINIDNNGSDEENSKDDKFRNLNELNQSKEDEYIHDSSDEEDVKNTIGNVPLEWYNDFDHIGYDIAGKKILKADKPGDELDEFIQKMDNPDYWRTVRDKSTGKKVVLSEEDISIVRSYIKGKESTKDSDMLFDEPFVRETMLHPVTNRPEHKRSFTPSKWEKLRVGQLVHAIKMGWIKITEKKEEVEDDQIKPKFYELWTAESDIKKRMRQYIPAPKLALPGHAESYNPPPEYLFTPEEEEKWKNTDPAERRMNFIPQKFDCLRHVPNYSRFVNERFERCLDLYLCPRQVKMRANMKAEDLLPKLPKPRDLQPFPTTQSIIYRGHSDAVRCISVDPHGLWLASGSEDKTVKIWEISTGYCIKTINFDQNVNCISWNPVPQKAIIAVAVGNQLHVINSQLGSQYMLAEEILSTKVENNNVDSKCEWEYDDGKIIIKHPTIIGQITWQKKGDYFLSVLKETQNSSIMIHHLTKKSTMNPFKKTKGRVQCAKFHPNKPLLYVATQLNVRIYDLVKQQLIKKLMANCKWISSMAIHPGGDNFIIGSYDNRLSWFDTDLSNKPYQTLKHHKRAIRQVNYHSYLPLFASASDDGSVIVCHGQVYNDLTINPLIVPVKILKGHVITKNLGVLDCVFHPSEPWLFSCGADMTIRLYT